MKHIETKENSQRRPNNNVVTSQVAQSCPTLCDPMEFSRQEYWSGLPFPSSGDFSDPETEPMSSALQADSLPSEPPGKPLLIKPTKLLSSCCSFCLELFNS